MTSQSWFSVSEGNSVGFRFMFVALWCAGLVMTALAVPPQGRAGARGAPQVGTQPQRGRGDFPDGTAIYREVAYVKDGHHQQTLDLYVPKSKTPVPLIIFVH